MANGVTNKDLYESLDRMKDNLEGVRKELKSDIIRLENKFDSLEAGRLARAEDKIKDLQIRDSTLNVKMAVIVFIAVTISESLIGALVYNFIGLVHK